MTWICPYCGKENERDERIGRREPTCKLCGEVRTTPEELTKLKETSIVKLEKEQDKLNERAAVIRGKMSSVVDDISELEIELSGLKEEMEELCAEAAPIKSALSDWEDQPIFFEKQDRAFIAAQDPNQAKLPFEVAV
jgi:predicted nuclease with TOPRIM domain